MDHAYGAWMHLELFADLIGVEVIDGEPSGGRWGEYDADNHTITLLRGLGPVQRYSTLSHELAHAAYGHRGNVPEQEKQAHQFSWWLTIPLCGFLKAATAHETAQAVAHELGVMPEMVAGYSERGKRVCGRR